MTPQTPNTHGSQDSRAMLIALESLRYALLDPQGLPAAIARAMNAVLNGTNSAPARERRAQTPTPATAAAQQAASRPSSDLGVNDRGGSALLKLLSKHRDIRGNGGEGSGWIGRRVDGAMDTTKAMGTMFVNRLSATLGPLAIFAQTMQSTGSGFGVLQKAIQLFAAVLAPVLLPIMVMLAVFFVELSKVIMKDMMPALKKFYAFFIDWILPVLKQFAQVLGTVIGVVFKMIGAFAEGLSKIGSMFGNLGTTLKDKTPTTSTQILNSATGGILSKLPIFEDMLRNDDEATGRSGDGSGEGIFTTMDKMTKKLTDDLSGISPELRDRVDSAKAAGAGDDNESLKMVIQSLKMSMGPKASIGGIAQAQKNAQLAAINADPLDALMLKAQMQTVQLLEEVAFNTKSGGVGS